MCVSTYCELPLYSVLKVPVQHLCESWATIFILSCLYSLLATICGDICHAQFETHLFFWSIRSKHFYIAVTLDTAMFKYLILPAYWGF